MGHHVVTKGDPATSSGLGNVGGDLCRLSGHNIPRLPFPCHPSLAVCVAMSSSDDPSRRGVPLVRAPAAPVLFDAEKELGRSTASVFPKTHGKADGHHVAAADALREAVLGAAQAPRFVTESELQVHHVVNCTRAFSHSLAARLCEPMRRNTNATFGLLKTES